MGDVIILVNPPPILQTQDPDESGLTFDLRRTVLTFETKSK